MYPEPPRIHWPCLSLSTIIVNVDAPGTGVSAEQDVEVASAVDLACAWLAVLLLLFVLWHSGHVVACRRVQQKERNAALSHLEGGKE